MNDTVKDINKRIAFKKGELLGEFGYDVRHDPKGNIVLNGRFFGITFDTPQEIEACLVGIYEGLHHAKFPGCTDWNKTLEEKKELDLSCGFDIVQCHECSKRED